MATTAASVAEICAGAKRASRELARLDTTTKNAAIGAMADALEARVDEILEANARDMEAGREASLDASLLDRLLLTPERVAGIARDARRIVALPDPVGEVIAGSRMYNGLDLRQVRVPLGVVAVVYEARPNVTIDCSALCLKSGNAIVLRGSSTALHSNTVLASIASEAVSGAGLPDGAVSLVAGGDRDELRELATQEGIVDLIIPRGGEGLKAALKEHAKVPVIYAASGNCHVYVDESRRSRRRGGDHAQREGAAAQRVQRRRDAARALRDRAHVPAARSALSCASRASSYGWTRGRARWRATSPGSLNDAAEEDWATEYHALILAVKVVDSADEAIEHVNRYTSGHSDAVVTQSTDVARAFTSGVDTACVYVNASTRFTDGGEFGMGAEIGNSTQKLHARGPIGLRELCTYKYVVEGSGQVRE